MDEATQTNETTEAGANTALLVVDVQVAVIAGEAPHHNADGVLERIAGLLDRARAAGTPVIYVQHEAQTYPPMQVGADGWQIHPAVAPRPGEPSVRKRACDAFYKTTLEEELAARGIGALIVCGCDSDYCIDTTVRSALSHGYDVTLVADAHTTSDSPVLPAAQIIAHVNDTLNGLPIDRDSRVVPAAEVSFAPA